MYKIVISLRSDSDYNKEASYLVIYSKLLCLWWVYANVVSMARQLLWKPTFYQLFAVWLT